MGTSLADRSDFDFKETYARGNAELRPNDWSVFKGSVGLEAYVHRAERRRTTSRSRAR